MSDGPSAGGRWDEEDEAARMSTPELEPCPFCGSPAKLSDGGGSHATCDCISKVSAPGWLHILHWNTRANPAESALNAAREAMKRFGDPDAYFPMRGQYVQEMCDLAKAALAQIDKALSPQQSKTT